MTIYYFRDHFAKLSFPHYKGNLVSQNDHGGGGQEFSIQPDPPAVQWHP